jgi:hypothetical protein
VLPIQTEETSLMKIIKSTGPRTDPCGTPLKTEDVDEKQFSRTTHCSLLCKKADKKDNNLPLMP